MSVKPAARVITESLGGSALSAAAQSGGLPAALQLWRPSSPAEWATHIERCRGRTGKDWYDRLKDALMPSGAAADRLAKVAGGRGVVVTTGQQPGLFGGPLYTLAKALTALELADAVQRATGVAAAPVFWAATDDSDFAEASVGALADADGLHELAHTERPASGTPMSDAPVGELTRQIERLRAACGSAPNTQYLESAVRAYSKGRTIGGSYIQLLRELLEPLGIAVLDASSRAYRDAARPILAEALKSAEKIAAALSARADAIRKAGFEPQVEDDRGLSLVFALEQGIKRRLTVAESAKVSTGTVLAPNVLLRPVVEREILPTIAYVGGPGEVAYFTQCDAVAVALGRERLVVVPRWSGTVVEPYVEKALTRIGASLAELDDMPALEKRLARKALPDAVAKAWRQLAEQTKAATQVLARAVQESSLMPPAVIEGLSNSLGHRLGRAERRLLAAAKRKDDAVRRDLASAAAAIVPKGKRQERVLNFIPMLARGGETLVNALRSGAREHAAKLLG